jgi:hypothetical protein
MRAVPKKTVPLRGKVGIERAPTNMVDVDLISIEQAALGISLSKHVVLRRVLR